jgi:hypothetical protein
MWSDSVDENLVCKILALDSRTPEWKIQIKSHINTNQKKAESLLCLCHFFNKISDKSRTRPAWNWGKRKWGEGGQGGEMAQTMYAHVNKWKKKKKKTAEISIIVLDKV